MEQVKNSNSDNMNINFLQVIIQDNNFLKATGSALLCYLTNLLMFDMTLILSSMTYVLSFAGAGMSVYNAYLTIQLKKAQLKKKKKNDDE